jgi:hypothetical protein
MFGPWLKAIIYKGSSSEERSRGSSDRDGLGKHNSTGSKYGSEGPSWRKPLLDKPEGNISRKDEEKEVSSPLKNTQGDQAGSDGGRKLASDERQHMSNIENNE